MEILGIGPLEFLVIVIIALFIMGPKDMEKAGRSLGRWLNRIVKSDTWRVMKDTSREIRGLPTRLMREANLEEIQKEINEPLPKLDDDDAGKNASQSYRPLPVTVSSPPAPAGEPAPPEGGKMQTPAKPAVSKQAPKKRAPKKNTDPKPKSPAPGEKKPAAKARRDSHA